jgi:hypothetical protein
MSNESQLRSRPAANEPLEYDFDIVLSNLKHYVRRQKTGRDVSLLDFSSSIAAASHAFRIDQ